MVSMSVSTKDSSPLSVTYPSLAVTTNFVDKDQTGQAQDILELTDIEKVVGMFARHNVFGFESTTESVSHKIAHSMKVDTSIIDSDGKVYVGIDRDRFIQFANNGQISNAVICRSTHQVTGL